MLNSSANNNDKANNDSWNYNQPNTDYLYTSPGWIWMVSKSSQPADLHTLSNTANSHIEFVRQAL